MPRRTWRAWWRDLWTPGLYESPDASGTVEATPILHADCGHASQRYARSLRTGETLCRDCHQFAMTHRSHNWLREPASGACLCTTCGALHWSCERLPAHDHRADRVRELVSRPGF